MQDRPIFVTESDATRIRGLLAVRGTVARDQEHLQELKAELERAVALEPGSMPRDVVTMHSRVRVLDLTSGERRELVLAFPWQSDISAQRISVLAPLGTALLGYREGDEVEWVMPGGLRRLRIERVRQASGTGASGARERLAAAAV
jgi:regulator of nucleoside diphosphate kinase